MKWKSGWNRTIIFWIWVIYYLKKKINIFNCGTINSDIDAEKLRNFIIYLINNPSNLNLLNKGNKDNKGIY